MDTPLDFNLKRRLGMGRVSSNSVVKLSRFILVCCYLVQTQFIQCHLGHCHLSPIFSCSNHPLGHYCCFTVKCVFGPLVNVILTQSYLLKLPLMQKKNKKMFYGRDQPMFSVQGEFFCQNLVNSALFDQFFFFFLQNIRKQIRIFSP